VQAACSGGAITFDNTTGLARYTGLLVRVEKRFSGRVQLLGSYALATNTGSNGTAAQGGLGFSSLNWFENYGPLPRDLRHVASVSGFVELPKQFQLAFNTYLSSRPPFTAWVSGMDFNGDGLANDLLPGSKVNHFGRGLDPSDLMRLVDLYNQQFAGKKTLGGQTAPLLKLPAYYSFGEGVFTQDVRVSRSFAIRERARFVLLGEVFNLFNVANLLGYNGNLLNPAVFGQPTSRFDQVFGSGGPRAFQLGARISF
jgi:hypothetical protein